MGKTREIAGGYMKDAWQAEPVKSDLQMNMGVPLDYWVLQTYEQTYLDGVKPDLRGWRLWR